MNKYVDQHAAPGRPRFVVGIGLGLLAYTGLAGGAFGGITPTFNTGASSLAANHNPGGPGGGATFASFMALPGGSASLISPFNTPSGHLTTFYPGGTTKAKAGAGRSQASNSAKITFPTGMGIEQTDPSHTQTSSKMACNFDFVWDITGGTMGPPINGNFSVPVGAKVGAGGFAKFGVDVHWDAVINGVTMFDRRAPYNDSFTWNTAGTFTKSFTAPAAAFSPSSIPDSAGIDRIIIRGSMTFEVNNDTDTVILEILGKLPQDERETSFANELMLNPQDEAGTGFEEEQLPEPGSALLLAGGCTILLRRCRARRM